MITKTKDKMNTKIEEQLDKQFPKGDKARGRALVLHTIAQIEIRKLEAKRKYWENKFKKLEDKRTSYPKPKSYGRTY